ncbi:MAG: hypothetical protein WAM14_22310 [Candidatus Nitrosopolaris sp.]
MKRSTCLLAQVIIAQVDKSVSSNSSSGDSGSRGGRGDSDGGDSK